MGSNRRITVSRDALGDSANRQYGMGLAASAAERRQAQHTRAVESRSGTGGRVSTANAAFWVGMETSDAMARHLVSVAVDPDGNSYRNRRMALSRLGILPPVALNRACHQHRAIARRFGHVPPRAMGK